MTTPTASDVHIDVALTNISVGYYQTADDFMFNKVFPQAPVAKQSDKYFVWDRGDQYRNNAGARAPGTRARRMGIRLSNDSYFCEAYALAHEIPDPIRANADESVNLETNASRTLTQQLMIQAEQKWVDEYFTTGVWGTDVVGGTNFTKWDNFGSSDPLKNVSDGRIVVKKNTGFRANTMVVSEEVHESLKRHPLILDRTKHTSAESITNQILARYFEVANYYVAGAVKTTSEEGAATDTFDFIAGKNAWIGYVTPAPALDTPTAGYTFVWSGYTGVNNMGIRVKNYRDEDIESDIIEATFAYDQKVVDTKMGYFFSQVID